MDTLRIARIRILAQTAISGQRREECIREILEIAQDLLGGKPADSEPRKRRGGFDRMEPKPSITE